MFQNVLKAQGKILHIFSEAGLSTRFLVLVVQCLVNSNVARKDTLMHSRSFVCKIPKKKHLKKLVLVSPRRKQMSIPELRRATSTSTSERFVFAKSTV